MRHPFELTEAKEPTGTLDRVDGAEDARERLRCTRILFQRDQIRVEPVEVLVALHEELAYSIVQVAHSGGAPRREAAGLRRWCRVVVVTRHGRAQGATGPRTVHRPLITQS